MNLRISGQIIIMKETKYLGMVMDDLWKSYRHCEAKTKLSKWSTSQVKALY